eukprot:361158-Chlamydomonas_euryale.AAC.1
MVAAGSGVSCFSAADIVAAGAADCVPNAGRRTCASAAMAAGGSTRSSFDACSWNPGVTHAPRSLEMPACTAVGFEQRLGSGEGTLSGWTGETGWGC